MSCFFLSTTNQCYNVGVDASAKLVLLKLDWTGERFVYSSLLDFGITYDGGISEIGPKYTPTINWSDMETSDNEVTIGNIKDTWEMFGVGLYDAVGGACSFYWNVEKFTSDYKSIIERLG